MADKYRRILEGFFPCTGGCRCPADTPHPSNARAQRRLGRTRARTRRRTRAVIRDLDRRSLARDGDCF